MKLKLFLLVLLGSPSLVQADCLQWVSDHKIIVGIGATGVTLGGIGLIYALATRKPSNEKVLAKARNTYESLKEKYGRMDLLDQENLVRCTEQDLATLVFHRDMRLIPSVVMDLRKLQERINKLQKRVYSGSNKNNGVIHDMRLLHREMKQLAQKLNNINLFWQKHSCFFDLYHQVRKFSDYYDQARADVYDTQLVRRAVMEISVQSRTEYPYLRFSETLKSDIDGLKYRMDKAKRYEVLYGKAGRLLQSLTSLLGTVASLSEYKQELHLRQKHKLEQERVEAMREKARAERMKADAFAQQAAAERQKTQAMREQAQAERQKAHALEDQNLIAVMQPKQPANVTVNVQAPMHSDSSSHKPNIHEANMN